MFDVNASIAELEWCMSKPSCPGALINGYSTDGRNATPNYYDSRAYDPFWSKVQQLKAKMYFHPRSAEARPMWAEYPELMNSPWGFSLETGEHMLRFILGGFFDRFPGVTFIIGHNGEMLAYWANRIDHRSVGRHSCLPATCSCQRASPRALREHLHPVDHVVQPVFFRAGW